MDKIETYKEMVNSFSALEVKGATMPYTSVNGNMFSFFSKDGQLSIRLSEKDRDKFIKQHKTGLSIQHGVIMKEYVVIPDSLFKKPTILEECLKKSYDYALTLKPKSTTRKKNK